MIGLGFPNLINEATSASGGDWETELPVTNATTRVDADVARTVDASAASSILIFDHGSAVTARVLVVRWHNLSADATLTWKRGTTSGDDDVDSSDSVDAWVISPYSFDGHSHQVVIVLSTANAARYDTIEIVDESNADGYIEVGQVLIAPLLTTSYNASYGLRHGFQDLSTKDRSDGGSRRVYKRRRIKTATFNFDLLSESEGDVIHDVQAEAGTTDQVIYIPRISDRAETQRYGGSGALEELSDAEYPRYQGRKTAIRWTED